VKDFSDERLGEKPELFVSIGAEIGGVAFCLGPCEIESFLREVCDDWNKVQRGVPFSEGVGEFSNNLLCLGDFPAAFLAVLSNLAVEVVDVMKADAGEFCEVRVHVSRDGDIDDEKLLDPVFEDGFGDSKCHERVFGGCGGDEQVDVGKLRLDVVE